MLYWRGIMSESCLLYWSFWKLNWIILYFNWKDIRIKVIRYIKWRDVMNTFFGCGGHFACRFSYVNVRRKVVVKHSINKVMLMLIGKNIIELFCVFHWISRTWKHIVCQQKKLYVILGRNCERNCLTVVAILNINAVIFKIAIARVIRCSPLDL